MKYIGESAIKKLISLIKGDLVAKQDTITASGLLKGDGTNISAAIAGTDYMIPASNQSAALVGQVLTKTSTGAEWTTIQGGGGSQPVEVDLSDSITMDSENPFVSGIEVGYNKSVGEKIKQAALTGSAKVTILLKVGTGEPEKVTLPMFGTQSAVNDGLLAYGLTGTYVWGGMVGFDIMIATTISDNSCIVVKHIAPWHQKPIYDPVDKPDETPDGAFLRWSSEKKAWVAETVPAAEGGTF